MSFGISSTNFTQSANFQSTTPLAPSSFDSPPQSTVQLFPPNSFGAGNAHGGQCHGHCGSSSSSQDDSASQATNTLMQALQAIVPMAEELMKTIGLGGGAGV